MLENFEIEIKFNKKLLNVRISLKILSLYTSMAFDGFSCIFNSKILLLSFRNKCLSFILMEEAM